MVLDRIGSVLGGKRYSDDSGEDKTYNANRSPVDKPYDINNNDNNSNDKPNDTKENNTNNNT